MTDDFRHGPIRVRHDFTIPEAVGISIHVGDAVIYVQSTPRGRKAGISVHNGRITRISLDVVKQWRGQGAVPPVTVEELAEWNGRPRANAPTCSSGLGHDYVMDGGTRCRSCGHVRVGLPDYMCPNCLTPWKCNGPHIPEPVG